MKLFHLWLFVVCNLICLRAKADTFTVVNNNDNGPGSLREAIQKANANNEKDIILFNIDGTSELARTISLQSQLPTITSSITIDGSSQPGTPFGRSDAKIILQPSSGTPPINAFVLNNADGVGFYGLYVRDFKGRLPGAEMYFASFIYAQNSKNVQIGAPAKGNVITNCSSMIFNSEYDIYNSEIQYILGIENLKLKSNFIGFEPDGKTFRGTPDGLGGGLNVTLCKGIYEIGGDDVADRNYFANMVVFFHVYYSQKPSKRYAIDFILKNNYFNFDINGNPTATLTSDGSNDFLVLYQTYGGDTFPQQSGSATIQNNKTINKFRVQMYNLTGPIVFQGNQFLPYPNPTVDENFERTIQLTSSEAVKVGGENPGEANILYDVSVYINSPKSAMAQRNSIYCDDNKQDNDVFIALGGKIPTINITNVTSTLVTGKTVPGASVEVFADDDCITCQPQTYLNTVVADGNGDWSCSGNFNKGVIASATLNGYTSIFTRFVMNSTWKIVNSSCNENNGEITGVLVENAIGYTWLDENNNEVGNTADIKNLKPGKYKLVVKNISCNRTYTDFEIKDLTPRLNDTYLNRIDPTCAKPGSINSLFLPNSDQYQLVWTNQYGEKVSTTLNPQNLASGSYTLSIKYKEQCEVKYGPVILRSSLFPTTITENHVVKENTTCGQNIGSIKGIEITGPSNIIYKWKNERAETVGSDLDLLNMPAGKYFLEVNNPTDCSTIYSSAFEIFEENGIQINADKVSPIDATCSLANGGIKGLLVSGATDYRWLNEKNETVSNTLELNNVIAGKYRLEASNIYCKKFSQSFTIKQLASTINITASKFDFKDAYCGLNNGFVEYTIIAATRTPKSFYWVNELGETIANGNRITGIGPGNYTIYGVDDNNCPLLLGTQKIEAISLLGIDHNVVVISSSKCRQNNGSISGLRILGGAMPYHYQWFDADERLISQSLDVNNLSAGNYEIRVTDNNNCSVVNDFFTVTDETSFIDEPVIDPVVLCSAGEANILVKNFAKGLSYMLYDDETTERAINKYNGEKINIYLSPGKSYYITAKIGNCESNRIKINVSFGTLGGAIPNTITPNGDNINDKWEIKGIENYPKATVQVFSRLGIKVFESVGYKAPFDGSYKGVYLPVGVYYYVINFGQGCKQITGSLTIIH